MVFPMNAPAQSLMRNEIYATLKREILCCAILPGAELREAELAERFAVSKSPIRDALLRLESDRLVVVHPRKGYQAAPVSLSDAADLFELRAMLEGACARDAAEHAADGALKTLDRFRSLDTFAASASDDPAPSFVLYNRGFHLAITELCSNKRLREATVDLIEQFDRLVIVSLQNGAPEGHSKLIAEHIDIIDAVQARDGRLAARRLSDHVTRARKRVLAALSRFAIVP